MLERFWRALGFPDVDDDDRAFTDLDLEAVRLFQGLQALGAADAETAVQMARVIGSSMARIAEAELVPGDMVSAEVDPVLSAEAFAGVADVTIPAMARLLEFVWRRQVAAGHPAQHDAAQPRPGARAEPRPGRGLRRHGRLHPAEPAPERRGAGRRGAALRGDLPRHRDSARGRVVKMIGDEVMFVVDSVADAARIGLSLAEAYADDELLSDVRVGLAFGPVLAPGRRLLRAGGQPGQPDGQHRQPGTVLMSDEFHTRPAGARRPASSPRRRCGPGC